MTSLARPLVKHALLLSLLLLAAGIWPLLQLSHLTVDNSIDIWLDHTHPDYLEYQAFQNDYGSDEWLIVAFDLGHETTGSSNDEIRAVAAALRQIDSRIQVLSITDVNPLVKQRIGHLLLSQDGRVAGVLMNLQDVGTITNSRQLVDDVRAALTPFQEKYSFHLGGPPVLNSELDRISEQQSLLFISLAACVGLMTLYGLFRSFYLVMAVVVPAGMAVAWTMGLAAGFGMTMNMISTVLPVLLWVLTLAGGIHLLYHFRKEFCGGAPAPQALYSAIEAVIVPYGVATFTTATGFLSLLLSNMEPVRNLGLWSAAGLVICYMSNIILLPVLLRLGLHLPFAAKMTNRPPIPIETFRKAVQGYRWWIGAAGTVALLVPLFLLPRLQTESNVLSFFKDDARINQDYAFITQHLTGLSTIELDFRGPRPELAEYIAQFGERLKDLHGIDPVIFPVAEGLRMSIFAEEMDSMAFNKLVEQLRDILTELPAGRLDIRLTGSIVLLNSIQEELVRTQLKSFGMALAIIVVVLAIVFRSPVMVLIGTMVNLFPVLILAGIAATTGIPLNVATIMIASIAIGIAVDDTVFFLVRLRKEIGLGHEGAAAVDRTLSHMFGPISSTTLVVTVGFLVLTLAEFKPVAYFGLLGGLTMVLAWIGDVVLLPALLYCFPPRFKK